MTQDKQWHPVIPLSLLVFMFLLSPPISMGGQDITANWTHHNSKDQTADNAYTLTYSLELQQEITETMSLQESFRSSNGWREEQNNHTIDPSLRFTINNDLFLLELYGSGSRQQSSNVATQKQTNFDGSWSSSWDKRFWPNLRTSFGTDWQEDDESPKKTDSKTITESLALDWDFELFKVYYNFNRHQSADTVTDRDNRNTSNFARLEAHHSFLENRLNLGFSHQYTENRAVNIIKFDGSGDVKIRQALSQVLHGLDATPLVTTNELIPVTALHDGDLVTASSVTTDGDDTPPHNIGLKVDFKTIDTIYLYTTTDQSAASSSFIFDLYTSDNGTNWQLNNANQTFNYNKNRFEFPVPDLSNLWLKIVIRSSPLTSVDFSEVVTFQTVPASGGVFKQNTLSSNALTNVNLAFLLTKTLSLSYNIAVEDGQYGSGVDYERYNQGGNIKWQPLPILTTTLGLSESSQQNGEAEESEARSYTLNIDTIPLDTLNINMGLTRSEAYEGSNRQSVNHSIGMLTTAALYPDLDASLDINYAHNTQDSTEITTKNYNTTLTLTARLVPSLTANFTTGYQEILGSNGSTATDTSLLLNWRTSDLMSIHLSSQKNWLNNQSNSEGIRLSTAVSPTDTTQFSISYIYAKSTERIDKYTFFGSWSLGPHFTLQGNGSYSESQTQQEWQVQTQLVARFSIL